MSRSRLQSLNSNIDHMKCSLSSKNSPRNTVDFEAACSVYIRFRGVNGYSNYEDEAETVYVLRNMRGELARYKVQWGDPITITLPSIRRIRS